MLSFITGEAKEQPAPAAPTEIDKLRAELQRQKDAARLRARHGPQLTDAQVDEFLTGEADMIIRKAKAKEAEELIRQNEIALDKSYRDLACELVKKGSMLISLDGKRVKSLTPDLIFTCPHCSKSLGDLSGAVYQFAKRWHWCAEGARVDHFMVYSARSPLTEQGFAGSIQLSCPNCHKSVKGIVQIVVV